MGAPRTEKDSNDDERPQHQVTVQPFYMGKYPVTQAQWQKIMKNNPSHFKGEQRPVENISWNNTQEFLGKLNAVVKTNGRSSLRFRLPTEAEWEYACRAGTQTAYSFGDGHDQLGDYAWFNGNSNKQTHSVGEKWPNAFGLYDMHGNVWEWCQDTYHENYTGAPVDGNAWGSSDDNKRKVLRGGAWFYDPNYCRSAFRFWYMPDVQYLTFGFRIVSSIH